MVERRRKAQHSLVGLTALYWNALLGEEALVLQVLQVLQVLLVTLVLASYVLLLTLVLLVLQLEPLPLVLLVQE